MIGKQAPMQLGATFPHNEMKPDPGAVRAYAQGVEEMGYDYILAFDHVMGADWSARPDRNMSGRYSHRDAFYEPFVLFSFIAAATKRVGLATGVLILGQRQTALVAKQAATLDVLCAGRLRLGVGTGWNDVEYEALGMDFHNRGVRSEEQIAVLRALWTGDVVTFQGRWHKIVATGINPLPGQRPIPIWLGGTAEAVIKRVGRLADGWYLNTLANEKTLAAIQRARDYAQAAGRDPAALGIEGGINLAGREPEEQARLVAAWRDQARASHVTINTMRSGYQTVEGHLEALHRFKAAVGSMQPAD